MDKIQIENLTADREALWRSLKERTCNMENWNRDMGRLQSELTEAGEKLRNVTQERENALNSLRQIERCLDEQQGAFCDRIRELEEQVNKRECEVSEGAKLKIKKFTIGTPGTYL